jgi:hypothetical protein
MKGFLVGVAIAVSPFAAQAGEAASTLADEGRITANGQCRFRDIGQPASLCLKESG